VDEQDEQPAETEISETSDIRIVSAEDQLGLSLHSWCLD